MNPGKAALVAIAALSLVLLPAEARGDKLVAAGQAIPVKGSFLAEKEDLLAPLLPGLKSLGASFTLEGNRLTVNTARGREVRLEIGKSEAWVDGVLKPLPFPPRKIDGQVWLPARAFASFLGACLRWEEKARTIYLHPWVREVEFQETERTLRLTVSGEGRLRFESNRLENPLRLYFDFQEADLAGGDRELALNRGDLLSVRASQNSLSPDVVRLVIELAKWKPYRAQLAENGCVLNIDFPLPGAETLPPETPPIELSSLRVRQLSSRLAEVTLSVSGEAEWQWLPATEPKTHRLRLDNCLSKLGSTPLLPQDNLFISEIVVAAGGQESRFVDLTLRLKQDCARAVVSGPRELKVLLGRALLSETSIVVDPGHGGVTPGAISPALGPGAEVVLEKDVNLDIGLRLAAQLKAAQARVTLTREEDRTLLPVQPGNAASRTNELYARVDRANSLRADLFVSVHCNSSPNNPHEANGTETYYIKPDSQELARILQEEMVKGLGLKDGGVIRHPKPIIVLYRTGMPAVLVEVAYICNPTEARLLAKPEFRQEAAEAIFNGVKRYVEEGGILPYLAARLGAGGPPS
jgi:N-acetylmuramoyl-L-alanine amidase